MFRISNNRISITRGDIGVIQLKISTGYQTYYTFEVGDVITFAVYNQNGLPENAVILKEVVVDSTMVGTSVDISLTSEDTKIGNLINNPTIYWYEIQLNSEQTVIGYDNTGPKLFTLYPEGSDVI
jgi:hypothetical protein